MNGLLLPGALGLLLAITACVQQVARDPTATPAAQPAFAAPTPSAMATPEAAPMPTPESMLPTATPTAMPTPLAPTATPTPPQPLSLEVQGPDDGTTVRSGAVVVHGRTAPGATVTIGDVIAIVDGDGRFQAEVQLEPGANRIDVVASDDAGRTASATRTVTF